MPTYDFVNEETGETFEMQMSIAEMEKYEAILKQLEDLYPEEVSGHTI